MSHAPAGFWRRYAAWTLDAAIIGLPVLLLAWPVMTTAKAALGAAFAALSARLATLMLDGLASAQSPLLLSRQWLADPALLQATGALQSALGALLLPPLLGFVAASLAWHVGFERSRRQATPGQRALGLVVIDDAGRRLPAGYALLRFAAGSLSWLTLNLGHAMAALPPRHLALHDRVSGTRVRLRDPDAKALPAWAKAWIALQLLALLVANAWLLHVAMQAMQHGFDAML
jgi:uncharacterized RDD family membrane protein YckC